MPVYTSPYELTHFGVPGMKWGKRKALPKSDLRRRFDSAKSNSKSANKEYNRSFNKASANPLNAVTKKGTQRWEEAYDSAEKANKAGAKYKAVKLERKTAIKSKTNEINKNTSLGEKMVFNNATRKLAAKYVVDNNMTVAEATKKSRAVALRNTAVFMAAYGGIMVATLVKNNG